MIATRKGFLAGGLDALRQRQKRKRERPVLTPELEQKILDTTLKTRAADGTHWSVRVLTRQMGISRMMVQRIWQRHEIQPHRVEKFKISNDPKFEEKVRDVVGLYLNPPDRALVLCVDEKSQIQQFVAQSGGALVRTHHRPHDPSRNFSQRASSGTGRL